MIGKFEFQKGSYYMFLINFKRKFWGLLQFTMVLQFLSQHPNSTPKDHQKVYCRSLLCTRGNQQGDSNLIGSWLSFDWANSDRKSLSQFNINRPEHPKTQPIDEFQFYLAFSHYRKPVFLHYWSNLFWFRIRLHQIYYLQWAILENLS